jgi:hypothetical protein
MSGLTRNLDRQSLYLPAVTDASLLQPDARIFGVGLLNAQGKRKKAKQGLRRKMGGSSMAHRNQRRM